MKISYMIWRNISIFNGMCAIVLCAIQFLMISCAHVDVGGNIDEHYCIEREYKNINIKNVVDATVSVIEKNGYKFRDYNNEYTLIKTQWKNMKGDIHGLVTWDKQRQYNISIRRANFSNSVLLSFEIISKEKSPNSNVWNSKYVNCDSDDEIISFIESIDEILKNI